MNPTLQMRQYHQQAVLTSTPEQLVLKLYDLGIAACHRQDAARAARVLTELLASLNHEDGGELADRLSELYGYCLTQAASGNTTAVLAVLTGLREAWKDGVMSRRAA
jgi:flagellar secretion chaperone FliS